MKKGILFNARFYVSLILLAGSIWFVVQVISKAAYNQRYKIDLAEISSIRYGLLNADEWKHSVSEILAVKIREFQLTDENREKLQTQVENLMYKLLDEVEEILKNDMGAIKRFLMNTFVNLDKLRENIPELAATLLKEMEKPENKENLQAYFLSKLDSFVEGTFNKDEQKALNELIDNYGYADKEVAKSGLQEKVDTTEKAIITDSVWLFVLLFIVFGVNAIDMRHLSVRRSTLLLVVVTLLIICGLSIPMMDIEAKITKLNFQLMGEEIVFNDQVIFFQSKSILDVVWTLIKTSRFDMVLVGVLIFSFSVMFPVTKILATFFTIYFPKKIGSSAFVRFFTYKSGKWSMADVFVVAMFMAFIGFNGIVSDQLTHLSNYSKQVEILTTNGTNLRAGFYFFLTFCIAGLFLSQVLHKNQTESKHSKNHSVSL